jgi:uncharacterized membrane protein
MDALLVGLYFVAVLAAAVVAGGQLFCLLAVLPALPKFSEPVSVRVHQEALTFRPHVYLRATAATALAATALLLILQHQRLDLSYALTAAGFLAVLVSGFISARFEWPINDEINSWGPDGVGANYGALRQRWDAKHQLRTVLSITALACFIGAVLTR